VPFSRVSQIATTSKASLSFLGRHFTLRSESLFIASLSSPKKQQIRRVLKRSNPLFIREMTHGASTRASLPCFPRIDKEKTSTRYLVVSRAACLSSEQRVLLRDFIGTRLQFSEQMSEVASTPGRREEAKRSRHLFPLWMPHVANTAYTTLTVITL
jgi:hypothetical protein